MVSKVWLDSCFGEYNMRTLRSQSYIRKRAAFGLLNLSTGDVHVYGQSHEHSFSPLIRTVLLGPGDTMSARKVALLRVASHARNGHNAHSRVLRATNKVFSHVFSHL